MAAAEEEEEANLPRGRSPEPSSHETGCSEVEVEVERLQGEVKEMAEKILHYRRTLPRVAVEALESSMRAQRPRLSAQPSLGLEGVAGGEPERRGEDGDAVGTSGGASASEMDQEMIEKLQLFRKKTSQIAEVLPKLVKRMNDCIARVDRVCQDDVHINPVFRKQRKL